MSDYDVNITAVGIIKNPKPWSTGEVARAFFTVETRGFSIRNCILVQRIRTGGLMTFLPKGEHESGQKVIGCSDQQLMATITSAAKRAFEAIGGKI
jgi:hypothetical protein